MVNTIGIFIMGFAWGIGLTVIFVVSLDKWLRRKRRKERQPIFLFTDYGYDRKECEESHLPGDCPLCGGV